MGRQAPLIRLIKRGKITGVILPDCPELALGESASWLSAGGILKDFEIRDKRGEIREKVNHGMPPSFAHAAMAFYCHWGAK